MDNDFIICKVCGAIHPREGTCLICGKLVHTDEGTHRHRTVIEFDGIKQTVNIRYLGRMCGSLACSLKANDLP